MCLKPLIQLSAIVKSSRSQSTSKSTLVYMNNRHIQAYIYIVFITNKHNRKGSSNFEVRGLTIKPRENIMFKLGSEKI